MINRIAIKKALSDAIFNANDEILYDLFSSARTHEGLTFNAIDYLKDAVDEIEDANICAMCKFGKEDPCRYDCFEASKKFMSMEAVIKEVRK